MASIPNEIINKIGALQNQIWQTVAHIVTENCGQQVVFGSPLTVGAHASDMYGEVAAPMMVIQFAFASMPENTQILLLSQETVADLASLVGGTPIDEIDENVVSELRAAMEAIVQGLCLAIGNIRNETMVASGLNVRYQIFSFPPNLQKADEIVRTQVAMTGEELNGAVIWLLDNETAHMVLGEEIVEDDPRSSNGLGVDSFTAFQDSLQGGDDHSGLEILMDIPLEISVELGRVKMMVRDVVELSTGSIVEIEKAAGEPVDVLVNGRLVAHGEVVVIEDNFGVRITEILNPNERLSKLGEVA